MAIHPREAIVQTARLKLTAAIYGIMNELTVPELLSVVSTEFSNTISSVAKYMIREERHGDRSKPGGLV